MFVFVSIYSQSTTTDIESEDNTLYNSAGVDKRPNFIGGTGDVNDFVNQNFNNKNLSGKIFISFVIEKDGNLSSMKVDRDLGEGSGDELIRILNLCKNCWSPAEIEGKKVRCFFSPAIKIYNATELINLESNPEEDFNTTNSFIDNKQAESISKNNYTYWLKDGKIVKLYVYDGDGENYAVHVDYYFKNNIIYAYQKKEINAPDAINYKALIFIKNSKISKEEYWIQDVKKEKNEFEKELTLLGMSIQDNILRDKVTDKQIDLLVLSDLSKKFGF